MNIDEYHYMTDSVTKFNNFLRIFGWFHHPTDSLVSLRLIDHHLLHVITKTEIYHAGVSSLGDNKGFELQALRSIDDIDESVKLEFVTKNKKTIVVSLYDLCRDRIRVCPGLKMADKFIDEVNKNNYSVLDIGGRARSKIDRRQNFSVSNYVVLDILPDENVDVVGDAHAISSIFPSESFDSFYSVSVFEHLLMPWAVIPQINRVLKMGGIGFISTHQTLGMHDRPWDFWRFSDTAWDALFNRLTGFEIVDRCLGFEQYILPFIYRPEKRNAELSAGFEDSSVWVRKVGPCKLSWDVTPSDLIETQYPDHEDGFVKDDFTGSPSGSRTNN